MVKVKDNVRLAKFQARFIGKSKAKFGDLFDYSLCQYTSPKSAVALKCNQCQVVFKIRPDSHLSNDSKGCWRCNLNKSLELRGAVKKCNCCGVRVKYAGVSRMCKKCLAVERFEKTAVRDKLKQRPCKHCGKPLNSTNKAKVACSNECGYAGRSMGKVVLPCLVCGKEVERYKRQSDQSKGACCSLACQRRYSLEERHSSKSRAINWKRISHKAKKKWQKLESKKRKSTSIMYAFWLKCKIPDELYVSKWKRRCISSASGLKDRFVGEVRLRKVVKTWKLCFSVNLSRVKQKVLRNEKVGWEWKVESVASGLRRRRKVKSLQQGKKNILRHIELQAQRPKQLSFWG